MSDDEMPERIWALDTGLHMGCEWSEIEGAGTEYIRRDTLPGWMPIETAPQADSSKYFLACSVNNVVDEDDFYAQCAVVYRNKAGGLSADEDLDGEEIPLWFNPTHWMPLPAPPSAQ